MTPEELGKPPAAAMKSFYSPGGRGQIGLYFDKRFHPLGEVYAFTAIRLRCPVGEAPTYLLYGKKSIKEDKPMHARDSPQ